MKYISLACCWTLFVLASCGSQPEEGEVKRESTADLLPTDLVLNPRTAGSIDSSLLDKMPELTFQDTIHNFGDVLKDTEVAHDFVFENTGGAPLLISSANPSCGCTIGDYPREPVKPGEKSMIRVKFKPAGEGGFEEKSVSIQTNTARGNHKIYIRANTIVH